MMKKTFMKKTAVLPLVLATLFLLAGAAFAEGLSAEPPASELPQANLRLSDAELDALANLLLERITLLQANSAEQPVNEAPRASELAAPDGEAADGNERPHARRTNRRSSRTDRSAGQAESLEPFENPVDSAPNPPRRGKNARSMTGGKTKRCTCSCCIRN